MSSTFTMAAAWQMYLKQVLPADAPPMQRTECRLAFYAGAFALFNGIMGSLDPSPGVTEADVAVLENLEAEFDSFRAEVAATHRHGAPS